MNQINTIRTSGAGTGLLPARTAAGKCYLLPVVASLCLIASAVFPDRALTQSAGTSRSESTALSEVTIYLPAAHPAYETVERLRAAGLLTNVWLNQRPLSRLVIARALLEGSRGAGERGLTMLAREAEWRLREFARDLEPDGIAIEPGRTLLTLHWEGDHQTSITAEPTLEFAWDGRNDIHPDYSRAVIARWGFELYGTAGRGIGYASRYRESYENRQGSERQWPWYTGQNIYKSLSGFGENKGYVNSNSHVSWDGAVFGVDLRFDSPAWGPSPGSNLLLSGHAPGFGHAQLRLGLGDWFHYTMLAGSLSSGITDSARSYIPDEIEDFRRLQRQKYIIGHRLDLRLLPNLNLGLTEAIIAGDRFPELIYLVPTTSIWDSQHFLDDPDNLMMALDVSWQVRRGPYLYGALNIDEWQLHDTFADDSQNWIAFQLGGAWTLPFHDGRWHLWVEAARIHPNVYRHKYRVNDWTHANSGLGYWSGQNSEVIEGKLTFLATPRLLVTTWGRYARKGGEVSRLEQYQNPPVERFMDGADRHGAWVGTGLAWEGTRHWRLISEIVRAPERLWPHEPPPASLGQEWRFSVRWIYNPF